MVNNCPFGSDLLKNHFDGSQTPTRHTGRPGVHGRVVLVLCKMFVLLYSIRTLASFFTGTRTARPCLSGHPGAVGDSIIVNHHSQGIGQNCWFILFGWGGGG